MRTIKALPSSRRPALLSSASSQGFAQGILQKYRHGEARDPGYLTLIHRDFSPSIGGQETHFHQTFIHVRMQVKVDSYLGLNRETLPSEQTGYQGSKERVVITQASGSGRKVQAATLLYELFRKWEKSSGMIRKGYLPWITALSDGSKRNRWSSYVQSSVQRGSSLENLLLQERFQEQIHQDGFAQTLLKALVSDSKKTVSDRFQKPEARYVPPEVLIHTTRRSDPGDLKSMQHALERIWLEAATSVDADARARAPRSEAVRLGQSGVRYFSQLIGSGMEPRSGTWSFLNSLKRADERTASLSLDRSEGTERARADGGHLVRRTAHESTSWLVAYKQTELWWRWWENQSQDWLQSRVTLPSRPSRTMTAHPRLRVLQPIVFASSRQHLPTKSRWMRETVSEVPSIPVELKILESKRLSRMFQSVLPSMLQLVDTGSTKQQAVWARLKQLVVLAQQQFPQADIEGGQERHASRQRLRQVGRGREQQQSALTHWLRQLAINREKQATMLAFRVEQEQSIRLQSAHEQMLFGKTSLNPVIPVASYQQIDLLQHESWTDLALNVLHLKQGLPFYSQNTQVTDSSRTFPLLAQSVVRKSIAADWIQSLQYANDPFFFEKRGWFNQPWIREYLEATAEIEREAAGRASTARLVWNRFAPIVHVNLQRWQSLRDRIVSSTYKKNERFGSKETNRKSVTQQMVAKHIIARELLAAKNHAPWNLADELGHQSSFPVARTSVPSRGAMLQQDRHVFQMSYEIARQLLPFHSSKNMRADVVFFKDQDKFIRHERQVTNSMAHEHEQRSTWHTLSLKNERSIRRALLHVHNHDREALFLRLSRFRVAMLRATEQIGLGRTDRQRLDSPPALPYSPEEDVSDRNRWRRIAARWSSELGLTILLQKSAKPAAMSEFAKLGSTSGIAPTSNEKQTNDKPKSGWGESGDSRESRHSRLLQQVSSSWTKSVALRARLYLQALEQIRKTTQTDSRTETHFHNHHSLSTVHNRHDAQIVVQKESARLPSLAQGQKAKWTTDIPVRETRTLSSQHTSRAVQFARKISFDFVTDRTHSSQLSSHRRFQQKHSRREMQAVNQQMQKVQQVQQVQQVQLVKRLGRHEIEEAENRDAPLTIQQRVRQRRSLSSASIPAKKAEKSASLALSQRLAMQPALLSLLPLLQQSPRPNEASQRLSLPENASNIHRRIPRAEDSRARPTAPVQSPPFMEYLRKSNSSQEAAVQQSTTHSLQRQVDLQVKERSSNPTSLSTQEVDRLMDKMMKELDKRLTQERQRRGL
ncbi:hypothetical protein [Brevibacillus sp. 179-C9.3 HS]|uniref:hypothetical protein n=1 Tax=unclassified Brevibacillus TaxID=2684853 RepID=UPI0039A23A2E